MARISLTIPDAQLPRVVDALAASAGWQQGTETKAAAAHRAIVTFVRQTVRNHEQGVEQRQAEAEADERLRQRPDVAVE